MELEWTAAEMRVPKKPLLTKTEVCLYLEGIGEDVLDALIARGLFPRPIRISPNTLRWRNTWVGVYLQYQEMCAAAVADPPAGGKKGAAADS